MLSALSEAHLLHGVPLHWSRSLVSQVTYWAERQEQKGLSTRAQAATCMNRLPWCGRPVSKRRELGSIVATLVSAAEEEFWQWGSGWSAILEEMSQLTNTAGRKPFQKTTVSPSRPSKENIRSGNPAEIVHWKGSWNMKYTYEAARVNQKDGRSMQQDSAVCFWLVTAKQREPSFFSTLDHLLGCMCTSPSENGSFTIQF